MTGGTAEVLATFAAVWATLHAGHNLADHVLGQTDRQAAGKGHDGQVALGLTWRSSMLYNLRHVAAYHAVVAALLLIAWSALPLTLSWEGLAAGLTVSVVSHAFLDRRWPVRWLLEHTGSPGFAQLAGTGINGMYLADQALHGAALWGCALLIALL